jgi:hypothetical protein
VKQVVWHVLALLVLVIASAVSAHDGHGHDHGATHATGELQVALVSSELVVGPNRFAVGLFGPTGEHVREAVVHLHYFDLRDPTAPRLEAEADASPITTPDGLTTLFTHQRTFDRAGPWGVEVQAVLPDGSLAVRRVAFEVRERGHALAPGERAPIVATPTAAEAAGDLARITTAADPTPELYRTSLDASLAAGRPVALLFATPGFCRTRFCGPTYEVVRELEARYRDQIDFIHVEVFASLPNPAVNDWQLAPAMIAFGLATEPWLFLVDADGVVTFRVEGFFDAHEVEPHLGSLVAR